MASRTCRECGAHTPVPGGLCAPCASWAKTGISFKNPEWPPIEAKLKQGNVERSEPLPEDQYKVQGGRFTNKKSKKNVQDELF